MRKFALATAIAAGVTAVAAADGSFNPNDWSFFDETGGFGSISPDKLSLTSGDEGVGGYTGYSFIADMDKSISFDWEYFTGDPGFEYAGYSVNGDVFVLAGASASGSVMIDVNVGDKLTIWVFTVDGIFGPGDLSVTNFKSVPAPGALALLGLAGLAARRRRRA